MNNGTSWQKVVEDIRRVRSPKGRLRVGCFSIEGTVLHERALKAGATIEQVLIAQHYLEQPSSRIQRLMRQMKESNCQIHIIPDALFDQLAHQHSFGEILGLVTLPSQQTLSQFIQSKQDQPLILLGCVDVVDPGNLGSLVRTAHASGADALITIGHGDPFYPKAVRTSMGSIFKLPILHYKSEQPLMAELHQLQIEPIGTVVHGGISLPDAALAESPRVAIFMGSELLGLSEQVQAAMSRLVSIPMSAEIDSFSINAATAIILYEARRGR